MPGGLHMRWLKQQISASMCLLFVLSALTASAGPLSTAERYARRCHGQPLLRYHPQGTLLWGTLRGWTEEAAKDERASVLVSANLGGLLQAAAGTTSLALEGGHLAGADLTGAVLRGAASDGQPVEVAICGAEPSAEDPQTVWYRIEAWNPVAQDWENPCVATGEVPNPRALAMSGTWDATGAHHPAARKLTFACENGVISKCAQWGYKPWLSVNGRSLADHHQACTRMARADYCGDGTSHTQEGTLIDYYDSLGVTSRTTEVSQRWNPALASFEAAWAPDGAWCLARTRDGRALGTILKECPGRFTARVNELGDGDRCTVRRSGGKAPAAWLRNQSIDPYEVLRAQAR